MAPYAFHIRWTTPIRPARERLYYPTQGCLSYGANRPTKNSPSKANKKVWRVKSPNAEISECDKQKEIKKPVVGNLATSNGDIVIVQQGSMVDDHEASTSKAKPRDPKYTQPKWCLPGLTKTMKRRL